MKPKETKTECPECGYGSLGEYIPCKRHAAPHKTKEDSEESYGKIIRNAFGFPQLVMSEHVQDFLAQDRL